MKSALMLAFLMILFGATFAVAIPITGSATAPTTDIVESMSDGTSNPFTPAFKWIGNGNDQHMGSGQTWVHGSNFILDKITVQINPLSNAATFNAGTSMNIRLYTWNNATGSPTTAPPLQGVPIIEETGTLPNTFVNNTPQYVTFDVTNQNLLGGTQYAFILDFTTAIAPNSGFAAELSGVLLGNSAGTTYPNGQHRDWVEHSTSHGGDPDWDGSDDIVFFIQSAVPEPSSFVLAGMGLIGLIGYVRNRDRNRA